MSIVGLWSGREKKKRKIGMARKRAENREGSLGFPGVVKPVFTKDTLPFFLVTLPRNTFNATIHDLSHLGHLQIRVEGYSIRGVTQFCKCNNFFHTAANCFMKPRCLKCGKEHITKNCEITNRRTTYYGNAIRQNKTCLSDMRKAVWAVYFHIRSSDEEPLPSFCPVGPNSWCKYQNQVVEGSVETFRHSNKLPVAVMDAI
ncbi:uncharacterized protein TNCV_3224681 [Trichonephila clavipes]|nr:uncharacterized protein TNCV_3224681 [Trichonephila clavipes]